jgi:beta-phosphoglucomutase-like phosphatase (HAD superfamily)
MTKNSFPLPLQGILLDMDGVIVDSEPILLEAVNRLFAERGVAVGAADCKAFFGMGEDHMLEEGSPPSMASPSTFLAIWTGSMPYILS